LDDWQASSVRRAPSDDQQAGRGDPHRFASSDGGVRGKAVLVLSREGSLNIPVTPRRGGTGTHCRAIEGSLPDFDRGYPFIREKLRTQFCFSLPPMDRSGIRGIPSRAGHLINRRGDIFLYGSVLRLGRAASNIHFSRASLSYMPICQRT
jgi:hypothetical protein